MRTFTHTHKGGKRISAQFMLTCMYVAILDSLDRTFSAVPCGRRICFDFDEICSAPSQRLLPPSLKGADGPSRSLGLQKVALNDLVQQFSSRPSHGRQERRRSHGFDFGIDHLTCCAGGREWEGEDSFFWRWGGSDCLHFVNKNSLKDSSAAKQGG